MSELFQYHLRLLEALLFASENPIPEKVIANRLPEGVDIQTLLRKLTAMYKNRGVNLVKAGKNRAYRTAPDFGVKLVVDKENPSDREKYRLLEVLLESERPLHLGLPECSRQ